MTCESCGADEPELEPVNRVYVTPGSWDQAQSEQVLDDVEQWCFACRTQYPNRSADT